MTRESPHVRQEVRPLPVDLVYHNHFGPNSGVNVRIDGSRGLWFAALECPVDDVIV